MNLRYFDFGLSKRKGRAPHPTLSLPKGSGAGFTLLEMIIYIGISSVVLVALLNVMLTIFSTRSKTEAGAEVQQNLRYGVQRITVTARNALGVNTGASTFGSANGVLSFAMSGTTLNPTVYSLCGTQLCIKEGVSATVAVTASGALIDEFRLTNLTGSPAPATVKIRLHATDAYAGTIASQTAVMTLETSITLRQ